MLPLPLFTEVLRGVEDRGVLEDDEEDRDFDEDRGVLEDDEEVDGVWDLVLFEVRDLGDFGRTGFLGSSLMGDVLVLTGDVTGEYVFFCFVYNITSDGTTTDLGDVLV
jgi:hypothetical protein